MNITSNNWERLLCEELNKEYYKDLQRFLEREYEKYTVYPAKEEVFKALELTDYNDVKVVILGQDPYHGSGQADGLAFSVKTGVKKPPSLVNIFKELNSDIGIEISENGNLESWARQGVLLLNAIMTVREGHANSHKAKGWEIFTDKIISLLNEREKPVVFILWGANARSKKKIITNSKHLILESVHPSPLSVYNGFWESKPFSKANEFLMKNNEYVDWRIEKWMV